MLECHREAATEVVCVKGNLCIKDSLYMVTATKLSYGDIICPKLSSPEKFWKQRRQQHVVMANSTCAIAYQLFFSLGGIFTSLLPDCRVTEFPSSPKTGKKEPFLLKPLSLAAWDIKSLISEFTWLVKRLQ